MENTKPEAEEQVDAVDAVWYVLAEHGLTKAFDPVYTSKEEKAVRDKIRMVIDEERKGGRDRRMTDKEPTLSELIEQAEEVDLSGSFEGGPELLLKLAVATAKAVQELWEHQHALGAPEWGIGYSNTTKPIGYASKR